MPSLDIGGLSLWYDCVEGPKADMSAIPSVLIQGLGMQAIDWPASFVEGLAAERRVVIFDNRDAGLSQLFGPSIDRNLTMEDFPDQNGSPTSPPYTLLDMADDVAQLLTALDIRQAHLIGFSMGGMIAQILAARHPAQVASLVCLMSSAGQAWLESTAEADRMMRQSVLFEPDPQRLAEQWLMAESVHAGPTPLPDIATRETLLAQSLARGYHPAGIWRQACAMRATGDRQALLRTIRQPCLFIHGEQDPVIALRQSELAKILIPLTEFKILPATGHALTDANTAPIAAWIMSFWHQMPDISCPQSSIGHPI